MAEKFPIGIIGLGVMGRSLVRNLTRNGYTPLGYHPRPHLPEGFPMTVTDKIPDFVSRLEEPRTILLMVPAGAQVDSVIELLIPNISHGDIIIDGGNSFFEDTNTRYKKLTELGIHYIGMGISGGEQGALLGPSMMPGGSTEAWQYVKPMFEAISAKTNNGDPCVAWMGAEGAGHYVKMVHNGIEYGDMQLIAEVYDLLHRGAGISNEELAKIFGEWNQNELSSYLIEITADILTRIDEETGKSLVDVILDEAGQKGTGKWTSQNALDVGSAIPTINAAVEARLISSIKSERVEAAKVLGKSSGFTGDGQQLIKAAEKALYASKITSYAQGLSLLQKASKEFNWDLDLAQIVKVWRAGCIIRAELLSDIAAAFDRNPNLPNLMLDDAFRQAILSREEAWRTVVTTALKIGIPMLATYDSLAYFDAYRSAILPANLTQAQRDYFGAHTYRRVDKEGIFHTQWE